MAATTDSSPSTSASAPVSGGTESFFTPQRLKLLAYAGGALVVVAAAAWFMITASHRKEAFAARALDEARSSAEQGNMGVAVQQFTKVATTYKGTGAAYEASLGIAQARLVSGQNELAIASLGDFLKSNPPALYAAPANGLLGTAFENTSRWAEAEAAYRKASELYDVDYLKAASLLDAGRAARLGGKRDDAIAIYREIMAKYGKTAATTEAQIRLGELTSGQP